MKKIIVFVGMFLCASFIFATDLQTALKEAAEQFSASLKPKTIVAIMGIYSESDALSDIMLDELALQFVKTKKISVADRTNLATIKKEMNFQLSGEVSNNSVQQLGAKVGAETVVQGTLRQLKGNSYMIVIRALNVKTAEVVDMYRANIELNKAELKMMEGTVVQKKPKASALAIGFQNMFFGFGSYKNGHYIDGAVLTAGHLAGWIFIFAGAGLYATAYDNVPYRFSGYMGGPGYTEWEENREKEKEMGRKKSDAGIALMAVGSVLEVASIIYGFIVPRYYDAPSLFDFSAKNNKSGFKFDLVNTSKGDIAPQISYIHRY